MRRFFARLAALVRFGKADRELEREIESHLALLQDKFERRGLTPVEARLAARRSYGGVEQVKELHREERSFMWIERTIKDVRFGIRTLWRNPGFTAVAVVTLALGIGANAAIFSVVKAVLLEPLAYREADRLVTLLHDGTNPVAAGNYRDWRDQSSSFETMAAAEFWSPNLTGSDQPENIRALRMTQILLPMLGVDPSLGRVFTAGADLTGDDHQVVLSHGLWQRRFGGSGKILGQSITLDGEPYTVVGVMPPSFKFAPFWATRAELWAPLTFGDRAASRGGNSLRIFARLKPGISIDQARAEIKTITARLEQQYPGSNRDVVVTPLKENVVGNVETPLLLMLGAVGLVLLIACANVAHMLLARTISRQKELAVRTALGAGRTRVAGQFLTESLLLSALGGAAGLVVAQWGTKALVALSPTKIPRVETVTVDAPVLLFLLLITVLTALLFGLAPAIHSTAGNLTAALKEGGRGGSDGAGRNRMRNLLMVSEFALAYMLLIGAGLTLRSFAALRSVDPGFNPSGVLSMVVSVAGSNEAEPHRREIFYRRLLERVRAEPGVESASGINHLPLAGDLWGYSFIIEGRPQPRPGESPGAAYRIAMPGYFETMRLPLRRGRPFTEHDDARAPGVAIINERAASQYWPGEDPIGKRIAFNAAAGSAPTWLSIIGITANAKQLNWAAVPDPEVYLAVLQNRRFLSDDHSAYITLVVRTRGNPADLTPGVKAAVWSLNRNLPISEVRTMIQAVADATAQPRFEMLLFAVFGGVALILAAVGIYGVISYSVSRRTHQLGIRMSLGASLGDVRWSVMSQGVRQALAVTIAGAAGALVLSKLMSRMLYGVQPTDPLTFTGAAIILTLVALFAAYVPARRAARIEPVIALRNE
jgi:putative ABC transport system permease protein